ncbi:uncharacterized protein LOC122499088 [Leptopilina heterotoma]|uniref:uncharacterized protein LOC122499088 n=1 Tax=Leptopilina heterotoma TaxID=63436 RepID=UPI001CA8D655|nr:uncharacterized protein LOC122499088 [Leptopilina heterotoma]
MGRIYKSAEKSRKYCYYSESTIQKALSEVKRNKLSIRKASEKYNVPKSTLSDHLKIQNVKKFGRPTAISVEDEKYLLDSLLLCSEWGFPMKILDTRLIVQSYLERSGKVVKVFKNNLPGKDWVRNFLKRNPALTVRFCENIKRCRAKVSPEEINLFYDNLEKTLADVPPANIVNYDETNFTDDPGSVKVIVKRGTRHPERILDSSKSSISVMMAVTGDGKMLPPYTVYKAKNLYPTWIEGGVPGARYNRSVSESSWSQSTVRRQSSKSHISIGH